MAAFRGLRLILLLGLTALAAAIAFGLMATPQVGPASAASDKLAASVPTMGVAQRATGVEMLRTRRGAPTSRLVARDSTTYTNGEIVLSEVAFDLVAIGGKVTTIRAPSARMTPNGGQPPARPAPSESAGARDEEGSGSWDLSGGVIVDTTSGLMVASPALSYDEPHGVAQTSESVSFKRGTAEGRALGLRHDIDAGTIHLLHQVQASMPLSGMGQVKVDAASAVYHLDDGSFEMTDYRAVTERGERLTGTRLTARFREREGLERLEGDEGFTLESMHPIVGEQPASPLGRLLAAEGTRTMSGRRLAVVFGDDDKPVSLEVSGEASLTTSDSSGTGAPTSIAAQTLVFDLTHGSLSRARASGSVDLKGAPAEGQAAGFHLRSDELEAFLDPNQGSIRNVEGKGEIELSDQDLRSQGNRTYLDPNTGIVTLTGEAGEPAVATWPGRRIQADRIEVDRRQKTLSARGGVRASYQPPPAAAGAQDQAQGLPYFLPGETIFAMAGSLTFRNQGRLAHYHDHVRLWQGDNRLEASEIEMDETRGFVEARGDVISSFRQISSEAAASPTSSADGIISISSDRMSYDRAAGTILYTTRVIVTQGTTRITSDAVNVKLEPDGSSAERIEATGNVEMRHLGRQGHGDRLTADMRANTFRLVGIGREAVLQDESGQQVVRGIALTMDRVGDRILVESEVGGRTWITLKPH